MITQVQHICNTNITEPDNQFVCKKEEIEIQFISATRNDDKTIRSLCRGELLELMLRFSYIHERKKKIKHRRSVKDITRRNSVTVFNKHHYDKNKLENFGHSHKHYAKDTGSIKAGGRNDKSGHGFKNKESIFANIDPRHNIKNQIWTNVSKAVTNKAE